MSANANRFKKAKGHPETKFAAWDMLARCLNLMGLIGSLGQELRVEA